MYKDYAYVSMVIRFIKKVEKEKIHFISADFWTGKDHNMYSKSRESGHGPQLISRQG